MTDDLSTAPPPAASPQMPAAEPQAAAPQPAAPTPTPQPPAPAQQPASAAPTLNLGDVEIEVSVELGRRRLSIAELSQLRVGSVLPLDTAAGEPVSVYANGRHIAMGEVVVIDGKLGVRVGSLNGSAG